MAIIPNPGYQIDPTNPNAVVPIPGYNPDTTMPPAATVPPPNASQTGATSQSIQSTTPPTEEPPTANLQSGSQGQDVASLQNYLVQMGYLTPDQLTGGQGTYGPLTTAAVAKMQQDLGVQAGAAAGKYGPQTQAAIAQKYQGAFQSLQGSQVPNTQGDANALIQAGTQPSTDPVFGAMASSLAPIMQSLNQVLSNINNPALTATSLQTEYNQLQQQYNLPQLNSQMLNMQNIMNGTTDDIRSEITKAGGTATESQVQAMSAARNNVILKQYNALSTQYQAAQTNVQNMMQYATTDQATQLQRQQATASVTESMASIETQMVSMGMSMQQNAATNYRAILTGGGPDALVAAVGGSPQQTAIAESVLNLAPGTLSDQNAVSSMQTDWYKTQQLSIANQRAAIYGFSQGYTGGPSTVNNYYGPASSTGGTASVNPSGPDPVTNVDEKTLARPSWLNPQTQLSLSGDEMQQVVGASNGKVVADSNGNYTVPNTGYYIKQIDGRYVLGSAIPTTVAQSQGINTSQLESQLSGPNVPVLTYPQIQAIMQKPPPSTVSPLSTAFGREVRAAKSLISGVTGSAVYATAASAPLQFARVQAAINGDNSVSDTELLDADIMMAKGGGQVTQGQIDAIQGASSYSDKLNVFNQTVFGQGASLSGNQRQDILKLSHQLFGQYSDVYNKLYTSGINTLAQNHIPPSEWGGILPDFSSLITNGPPQ